MSSFLHFFSFLLRISLLVFVAHSQSDSFTHLKGTLQTGSYGVFNQRTVFDSESIPSGRQSYCLVYRNVEYESIWLFGGHGVSPLGDQKQNDLWEFKISSKEWRYWSGGANGGGQVLYDSSDFSIYNTPGMWSHLGCWMNPMTDELYLTLGRINVTYTNEMWVYGFDKKMFKRIIGKRLSNFGETGKFDENNVPPPLISWTNFIAYDGENSSYTFGGWNRDPDDFYDTNTDDLWEFDSSIMQWRHLKGSKSNESDSLYVSGNGNFDVSNVPQRRRSHCIWYFSDKVWIFGGLTYNPDLVYFNDLWAFSLEFNAWALMKGNPEGGYSSGQSRKDFFFNDENVPPSGSGQATFIFGESFIIFGGHNWDVIAEEQLDLSSLWVYSVRLNQWKFLYGYHGEYIRTNYKENIPGSRDNACFAGPSTNQNASYFFGGSCYNNSNADIYCNDIWMFSGFDCFDVYKDDEGVCSGRGVCSFADTCTCYSGIGEDCSESNTKTIVLIIFGVTAGSLIIAIIIGFIIGFFAFVFVTMLKQKKELKAYDDIGGKILLSEFSAENKNTPKIKVNMNLFTIPMNEIEIKKELGVGGSDTQIYKAIWKNSMVAYKLFKTNQLWSDQQVFTDFEKEISIISSIHHPNIISVYGASISHPRIGIVMEYAENGTIDSYIKNHLNEIDINEKIRWFGEIASSLEYLHGRGIIHRDLKCSNILLSDSLKIKLIDFGLSKFKDSGDDNTVRVGTAFYMAPEIALSGNYNEMVDLYSFSIVMFEILEENFNPYGLKISSGIEIKVASDPTFRPKFKNEKNYPSALIDIVKKCWEGEPSERYTAKEVIKKLEGLKNTKQKVLVDIQKI